MRGRGPPWGQASCGHGAFSVFASWPLGRERRRHGAAAPPPLPGFMPAFEITRIVRAAGFDPLAPPLREGTTYVIRATDFRGILMRVVVDARSGAVRAVNRIVPGAGTMSAWHGAAALWRGAGLSAARYRGPGHDAQRGDHSRAGAATAASSFDAAAAGSHPSSRRTSACIRSAIAATAPGGACIAQSRRRCQCPMPSLTRSPMPDRVYRPPANRT